jgi:transcriptional regulator with XRE-family HTH domain
MTQGELGGVLGVSQATVSTWEKGTSQPSDENMHNLVRELGITMDEWYAAIFAKDEVARAVLRDRRLPQETRLAVVNLYEQLLKGLGGDYATLIEA